jgi:outer membrane biosynthesis protein TonB
MAALLASVFAAAFVIAHTSGAADSVSERLPPSLPRVSTPVPSALTAAPPIELAVQPPPPPPKPPVTPRTTTAPAPSVVSPAPVQAAPVQTTPAPPAVQTTPAPTSTPAPSTPSKSGSGSKPGPEGGAGTSFESSS